MTANQSLPLTGFVVVDLSDECLSLAGRLLADLGAIVVRAEAAGGDALRTSGPHLDGNEGVEGALRHILYQAGKRSLGLNFASPEAWDIVDRLLERADVVLAPLQKSSDARRVLASERLRDVHPHLGLVDVVLRRGGEDLAVTDLLGVAAGGLPYGLGYPEVAPDYPAGRLAYKQASFVGAAAAAAILFEATKDKRGSHVCVSLQEAILSTTIHFANENMWRLAGSKMQRLGGRVSTLLQAKDGRWVTFGITPNTPKRWATFAAWLAEVTGYDGLVGAEFPGEVWATPYGSESHEALTRLCASLPSDALCAEGQARELLVVPVNTVDMVANDDHLLARGCFVDVPHPALGRTIRMPRLPVRSTAFEPLPRPAPALGEHSGAVLRALAGADDTEVSALRARGVVVGSDAGEPLPARPARIPIPPRRPHAGPLMRELLPLAGLRVADFTWMAAGPLTGELLANLGADVIKVESEARLDTLRGAIQPVSPPTIETGAFFQDCNTDKRSVTINLGTPDGVHLAKELVRGADVVIENFTWGVMERLGLGYEALRAVKPDIVMASFPVMGSFGPKATWRGIGNSVVAMCGLAGHTGAPDKKPLGVQLHTDFTLAPLAVLALLSALIQRDRTGQGQFIELAQYEAAIHLLDTELIEYLANGVTPPRHGNRSREMAPHGFFPCASGGSASERMQGDRWVAIAVRDTVDWVDLCRVIGADALRERTDLRTLAGRQAAEDDIEAAIAAWTAPRDVWEVTDALQRAGVPAGPLEDIEDLLERDPSMEGFFMEFAHPVGVPFLAQNQPFLWNGQRLPIHRAPFFGEHNDAVFRGELSLDEDEIARLITGQAIY